MKLSVGIYRHHRRAVPALLVAAIALIATSSLVPSDALAAANGGIITSGGPLTRIQTTSDLNCSVNHASDTAGEFYGGTACATLVAVSGTLYGPASIPAGSDAGPRTTWATSGQTSTGSGSASNPYRIETTVRGGGVSLTQVDTYITGTEYYSTTVRLTNTSASASVGGTLYRAGDCYLQNSDVGFGRVDEAAGAVACTAGQDAGSRIEQWAPLTPGSTYFEAGYSQVWSRIGEQLPFPNTCRCAEAIDNGAGLSWSFQLDPGATKAFSHLTAFSPQGITNVRDSDGDSFPDIWEQSDGGVDVDGDGADLRLADFGATVDKKDVFVQVGYTGQETCTLLIFFCDTRYRTPNLAALRDVQAAFLRRNIRLHIDAGPDSVMNPESGAKWGSRSAVSGPIADVPTPIPGWDPSAGTDGEFNWRQSFDGLKESQLPNERRRLFHYAMYVGEYDDDGANGSSGLARGALDAGNALSGSDFMVAGDVSYFGADGMDRVEEAGTFMHEFGHNLGLSHGGAETDGRIQWKPNYPSVMNYLWQSLGVRKNDSQASIDYSDGTLDALDGNNMSEADGLSPDSVANTMGVGWLCPFNSQGFAEQHDTVPAVRDVDWNCSTSSSVAVNANYRQYGVMRDHNDWASLVFDGYGAIGGAGDYSAQARVTSGSAEPTPAEMGVKQNARKNVMFSAPGNFITIQANTSAPVELTLANPHADARTYVLSVDEARGVSISGLPDRLTLDAGESRMVRISLSAGTESDTASFSLSATNGAIDSRTLRVDLRVVGQVVPDQPSGFGAGSGGPADPAPPNPLPPPVGLPASPAPAITPSTKLVCKNPKTTRVLSVQLSPGARKSGVAQLRVSSIKRIGKNPQIDYRVKLTRNCVTVAYGIATGKTLTLSVKSSGTITTIMGGKKLKKKAYPRLTGRYILQSNGGKAKVRPMAVVFK